MKFRDSATGAVFDNISAARKFYCNRDGSCIRCPIYAGNNGTGDYCETFVGEHPVDAARLMGYEIIREDTMNEKTDNSLKDWTLEEAMVLCEERAGDCDGCPFKLSAPNKYDKWCAIYAPPQHYQLPEATSFTPEEMTGVQWLAKCGVKWISRYGSKNSVDLWSEKPKNRGEFHANSDSIWCGWVTSEFLPSVKPGDCICVEEVTGDA